ncbi:MAG: response regulator [Dehalococcoidia bacterium]
MVTRKVLIVDDDPYLIKSLEFVFRMEGIDFDTARNGVEATEKIREEEPGVVLLDVMMPGKDGYEVCEDVKRDSELRDIHIVLLSAKARKSEVAHGFAVGADEYITKPFSIKVVVDLVEDVLSKVN